MIYFVCYIFTTSRSMIDSSVSVQYDCTKFESMFPDLQHLSSNTMCSKNVHIPLKHSQCFSLALSFAGCFVSIENGNSVKLNETKSCKGSYLENVKWLEFHWKYENRRMIQLIETCYTFTWCWWEWYHSSPQVTIRPIHGSLNENSVRSVKFNLLSGDQNASTLVLRCAVFSIHRHNQKTVVCRSCNTSTIASVH